MTKNETFNNNIKNNENDTLSKERTISISHNLSQLEKDICVLINYIRTNPLDFANNLLTRTKYLSQNKEQEEIINYLEELSNKEKLEPFIEMPEISHAAGNLLYNISANDKKFHNINLKDLKPSVLNLRTRLSNYGHRTGRIFETIVFKTDNPEDIVNNILKDEKGRNMLLTNKMKYIGIACDLLPSKIVCSIIDIVQDFIPYRAKKEVNININTKSENNKHEINNKHIDINNSNYDDNINNLKLKLNIGEKPMKKNNSNINIIKNNNNEKYSSNLIFNKFGNERKKNFFYNNNEYYKTPKKFDSMGSIPPEKNSFFSPTSVNSYNIIINNKIVPIKNKSNNINLINKKENINTLPEMNNKNIFTMAGRTTQEQQEVINISSKLNISKPKSLCSYDFNSKGSKMDNKNKFHRLNQKEKLEILHKINQRNKNPKSLSTNNKALEKIRSINPVSPNNNNIYNSDISLEERNKTNDLDNYVEQNTSNRLNTFLSKISDSNIVNYKNINGMSNIYPSYIESTNNDEYSRNKINEIKKDLVLFKNQIKKELKDEVKNELKEEIKYEFNISQHNKKPSSIKVEEEIDMENIINNKRNKGKDYNNKDSKIKLIDDEVYFKKNNSNYLNKNKIKNRCSSEEKFIYTKSNSSLGMPFSTKFFQKERKTYDKNNYMNSNINEENKIKDKFKAKYDQLNDFSQNSKNNSAYHNYKGGVKNLSNDFKNKSYFNEGNKIKNRQEIKKLIRLYNIAKDSKRGKNNEEIIYDIINNNKSISNILFLKNKNNEEEDNNEILNSKNDYNFKKHNITQNIFIKSNMYPMKYEKVKPIGNFHKYTKNNKEKDMKSLKEGKKGINYFNENNIVDNDYYFSKEKKKENEKSEIIFRNSTNEIFTLKTGKFVDDSSNKKNGNNNDNKEMIIKTYNDKNITFKESNKDKKEKILFTDFETEKNDINNNLEEDILKLNKKDNIINEFFDTNKYDSLNNLNNIIDSHFKNNES